MSPLPTCNEIFAVGILINIVGFETYTVLSILLSQGISERKNIGKNKLADSVLSRVFIAGNTLVGLTTFLSKITSRRI